MSIQPVLPAEIHGLHYTTPATTWDEALPLGNGIMGALVWGDGHPLAISLDRADLWDLSPVPECHSPEYTYAQMRQWHVEGRHDDLQRLYDEPYNRPAPTKIPAGRIQLNLNQASRFVEAHLHLREAYATTQWSDGTHAAFFLHATTPVGVGRITTTQPVDIHLVAPPFSGGVTDAAAGGINPGDMTQLGYPAPVLASGANWHSFTQAGAEGFHFAVYVAWRTQATTTHLAWSIASSFEGDQPFHLARARVDAALDTGFDQMFTEHATWWASYWQQSSIQLPHAQLERQWYLEQYKFGAAARRGAPPVTLQGPWTADDGQLPPWKGDYHHNLNTQMSYWPCYSGNHLDEGLSFLDWLWNTREQCRAWTERFFGMPGLNVPMTADLNNNQIGGWRQYTHSATTAAWLAHHFYLHWRYSMDREFLAARAYPYLHDAAVFIEAITVERDTDGLRTLPLSSSPEINDNRPEAWFSTITNYDLALIEWLLHAAAELATELGLIDDATHWRMVADELPTFAYSEDRALLVAKDYPLQESHRHFSHLMAIHPLQVISWRGGLHAQQTIRASLAELDRLGTDSWCGYSFSWFASFHAGIGNGERAAQALEIFTSAFTLRNSFHCNGDQSGQGYSRWTIRPFTLEGNFATAAAIQSMLIQSDNGAIRVFPAVPADWADVTFTTLRAEGALLVSAERRQGTTRWVEITAEQDGEYRLVSPFSGEELVLALQRGQTRRLTNDESSSV